jgi:hypothetical protein
MATAKRTAKSLTAYHQLMKALGPAGVRVDPYGHFGGGRCWACASRIRRPMFPHTEISGCDTYVAHPEAN